MRSRYDKMSKVELLEQLEALTADLRLRKSDVEGQRLIHDLQVHQIELEMQNRELQESQQTLEASRSRYADLYDFSPSAYFTLDERGVILEANLTAATMFGIARTQLAGTSFFQFVARGHQAGFRSKLRKCFAEQGAVTGEVNLSVRKRGPIAAQFGSAPYAEPGGKVACRIALTDISALKSAQKMLHFLVDASEMLASTLDCEATLARVARRAVPVLADVCVVHLASRDGGLRRVEAPLADLELHRAAVTARLASGLEWRGAQAEVLRTGAPLCVIDANSSAALREQLRQSGVHSLMIVPMSARARTFGVLSLFMTQSGRLFSDADLNVAQDLAHRAGMALDNARLYEDAQKAIRMRDDVVAVVAHDLSNPLGSVALNAESMLKRGDSFDTEARARSLIAIGRAVHQMKRLIRDLVDAGSIEDGRFSVVQEDRDAGEILRQTRDMLQPLATQRRIDLVIEGLRAPLDVSCDQDRILQVLSNIAGNAIKFTPEGGSVLLRIVRGKGEIAFVVEDTGPGIPAEDQPHVFDRFWRGADPGHQGRGLGLYIAKGIVEAHGGRIWAESRPGRGTSMSFALPFRMRDEPGTQDQDAVEQASSPCD